MSRNFKVARAVLGAAGVVTSAFGSAAAPLAPAGGLEEIVVTAQKREQSAQDVAISMSVIAGAELAEKSISFVNELANATPSLQVEPAFGSSQAQFRLRGIGFIDYTSNNTSPVGVNIDGVALALPIQTQGQLFDIDRVEVLRGPQGTLYGRNSTGGTINFVTNRPTEQTHYGAEVEYGMHNLFTAQAFASGRLAPSVTARLSVAAEQGGAWQRDRTTGASLGDRDKVALRGQLQWNPGERFDAHLGLHAARDNSDEQGLSLLRAYPAGSPAPLLPADQSPYITGWHLNPAFAALIGVAADARPGLHNTNYGVDLTGNVQLGVAKLSSITSWNKQIRREYADWDATAFDDSDEYLRSALQVFAEEVRLASSGTTQLEWVLGGIYSNEDLREDFYSDVLHAASGGIIAQTLYEQAVNSVGVFGQASFKFSERLKASVGVREDHENRELLGLNTSFLAGLVLPSTTGGPLSRSAVSNLPSGKVEFDYTPRAGTLLYASVSRGVKSGGFTAHNTFARSAVDPFSPEKLTAYELGVKADLGRTLRANAAGYYYRYRDQQVLTVIQGTTAGSFIGKFTNANSRISGGEVELDWLPAAGVRISQYAGFVEGYYTSPLFNVLRPGVNYLGSPESIPKWSYGGDARYALALGNYELAPELNYSFHDTYSQWFLLNSADYTIPRYWLVNANLSFAPTSGPWSVALWGRNITNRRYDLTRNFFLQSSEVAAAGEPATFGIRVKVRY